MQFKALESLVRNLIDAPRAESVKQAAAETSGTPHGPRELDANELRQVAGGMVVDLPKRGW